MIQKKCLRKRLSQSELNRYYDQYKAEASKKILHQNIFVSVLFFGALYLLYYFMAGDNFNSDWFIMGMFMAAFASIYIVNMIDKHNGKGGDNAYSFEEITKFERKSTKKDTPRHKLIKSARGARVCEYLKRQQSPDFF